MIRVVPAEPKHVYAIKPRAVFTKNPEVIDYVLYACKISHPVAVISPQEEVLAILGLQIFWPGVGEIWGYTSVLIDKYPILFYKTCQKLMKDLVKKNQFRRLQVTVNASYNQGTRFVERFGFKPEAMMRKYGPDGEDHVLFGRVF